MNSIGFVYNTPHPVHEIFASAIDADFIPAIRNDAEPVSSGIRRLLQYVRSSLSYPTEYEFVLAEGGRPLFPTALHKLRNRGGKLILLNADETFINVVEDLEYYGRMTGTVHKISSRAIDGMISVGKFIDSYAKRAGVSVPSEVVHPCILPEVYDRLESVSPDIGSNNIVTVGKAKPSVGFDILVEAFKIARASIPELDLHIAGRGHPQEWNDIEGVHLHGWVDDLSDFFSIGELSAHPGRAECFPVSTLEPLLAGCPCIVSRMVGTKDLIHDLSPELITDRAPSPVAEAIEWYFSQPDHEREQLSKGAKDIGTQFTVERSQDEFKEAFNSIVEKI